MVLARFWRGAVARTVPVSPAVPVLPVPVLPLHVQGVLTFSSELGVPACLDSHEPGFGVGDCDSGTALSGKGASETNSPNTLLLGPHRCTADGSDPGPDQIVYISVSTSGLRFVSGGYIDYAEVHAICSAAGAEVSEGPCPCTALHRPAGAQLVQATTESYCSVVSRDTVPPSVDTPPQLLAPLPHSSLAITMRRPVRHHRARTVPAPARRRRRLPTLPAYSAN